MGFAAAVFYYALTWLIPKSRDEIPFRQFGFDFDQLSLYLTEFGLLEASFAEVYKGIVCLVD